MQYKILNEQPWQILSNSMTISPSSTGYDLQVSANGKDYTTLFSVGAGVTRQVTNLSSGSYFRMLGNEGEVVVNWVRDCSGGGSGGGSGSGTTYTAGDYISLEGDVISVTGITPDQYLTSADTQDFVTQAYVDAALTAATQNMATEAYVDDAVTGATQGMATQQDIQTAIAAETARTENTYAKPADIPSLAGYATEAFVTGITDTIEDHLDDVERVTATALTELHDAVLAVSAATPDMSNYYTSAQTQSAITAATQDFITSAYTGFTTTEDFEEFAGQMEAKEEVVAAALVNLDQNKISGDGDITRIQRISQADYNDLVSGGTVDSYTFYVITGQTGN